MHQLVRNILIVSKTSLNYLRPCNNNSLCNVRRYCATTAYPNENGAAPKTAAVSDEQTVALAAAHTKSSSTKENINGQQRTLHVAIIGVPNAGKSTFINNLINHRVCPTSSKVHTTRRANKAIYTSHNTQLVFYDTPGIVTQREVKRHHLEQSFRSAYRHAVQHADVIGVMQDVSNAWTRSALHATVLDTLKAYPSLPSFLILNKIDTLKSKRVLLDLIRGLTNNTLSGSKRKQNAKIPPPRSADDEQSIGVDLQQREVTWSNFSDVFLVSSITGNGLSDVHDYLINSAKDATWEYPSDTFTDASPEVLIVDSVRARLLDYLPQEIPYNLHSEIEYYNEENNTLYASVRVICPTTRIERLICGESNGKLRQITERVTSDLVETFGKPISLTIATVSKKDKEN